VEGGERREGLKTGEERNFSLMRTETHSLRKNGIEALCANMSETSSPSTITVGRGKKSHFDEHKQDKQFFGCVGSFGA
jgi:hypothetical protein